MMTCLLVDDSRVIRKVARRILEDLDFECREAADGSEALKACRQDMPDLILLDWNMPVMNGLDFLKTLRKELRIEASESAGETRLRVTASGPRAKLLPAAADALTGQAPEGGFDGRSIQPYYIYLIIQEVGGRVDAQASEDRVELTALVPGA